MNPARTQPRNAGTKVPRTMQHQPNSVTTPNPETVHASSQPVCFCDELTVRQIDDRTIVPVSMRIALRAPELFQKL